MAIVVFKLTEYQKRNYQFTGRVDKIEEFDILYAQEIRDAGFKVEDIRLLVRNEPNKYTEFIELLKFLCSTLNCDVKDILEYIPDP